MPPVKLLCNHLELSMFDIANFFHAQSKFEDLLMAVMHHEGCPIIFDEKTREFTYDPDWNRICWINPISQIITFEWRNKECSTSSADLLEQ